MCADGGYPEVRIKKHHPLLILFGLISLEKKSMKKDQYSVSL